MPSVFETIFKSEGALSIFMMLIEFTLINISSVSVSDLTFPMEHWVFELSFIGHVL